MEIITKINTGQEVKIPIAAFQYIYTRLNQICVVDKNGNVQIVNSEEFKKFQKTTIALLDKDKEIKEDAANLLGKECYIYFYNKEISRRNNC